MNTNNQSIRILGICICDRIKEAGKLQQILTKYGEVIKTRFGFHEVSDDTCSRTGFVILQLTGDPVTFSELESELSEVGGIQVRNMNFTV